MKKHENTKRNSTSENTANITYRELKAALPSTGGVSVPSKKWLREHDEAVFCSVKFDGSVITVYDNGFYTYEKDGHTTILRVDGFDCIRYQFQDGASNTVAEAEYANSAFALPLVLNGENQMERNLAKREEYHHALSLENDGEDWCESLTIPSFVDEQEAREQTEEEICRLQSAKEYLTEHQRKIVELYFNRQMPEKEIAARVGITQQAVSKTLKQAIARLKKYF